MDFRRAAVVGAGVMGSGIAQTLAVAGLDTVCIDINDAVLERARERVVDGLGRAHAGGHLNQPVEDVMSRLHFTTDLQSGVRGCDLVLEAVPEDIGLKVRLFRELDAVVDPGCLLVTNTSGFAVSGLAYATDRPHPVLGWHWASPPAVMPFAEIIVHPDVDEHAAQRLRALAVACGKRPVLVKDQPMAWGFVANRVYFAMIREAQRVVDEGLVTAGELDQLMIDCFHWPAGPLVWAARHSLAGSNDTYCSPCAKVDRVISQAIRLGGK